MTCEHLIFSADNYIETATLTSTPAAATDLDELKNSYAARRGVWTNLAGEIVLEGVLEQPSYCSFFSIPGTNLRADALVKLEIFENETDTVPVLDTGYKEFGQMIPLGAWRAGIDPYGALYEPLNDVFTYWFDDLIQVAKFRLTINHGYDYVPTTSETVETPPVVTTQTVSDGIYRQGNDGVLSLESTSGVIRDSGPDTWETKSDAAASGGTFLEKAENDFYWNSSEGPRVSFEFTASQSGSHDFWVRIKSQPGANSFYALIDGNSKTVQMPTNLSSWTWYKARTVTLTDERRHTIGFAARDYDMVFDKVVVQPAGTAAPSGTGPSESGTGTTTITTVTEGSKITTIKAGSSDSVQLRMVMLGNTQTFERNFARGSQISFLTAPDLKTLHSGRAVIARPQRQSRRLSISMPRMSESDRLNMFRHETTRLGKPFLISAFPGRADWYTGNYMFLGRFSNPLSYTHRYEGMHSTSFELVEV